MNEVLIYTREDFIKILTLLKNKTKYIELVIPYGDNENDDLVQFLEPYLTTKKKVKSWTGTKTKGKSSTMYKYEYNEQDEKKILKFLHNYSSFFFHIKDSDGFYNEVKLTEFGDKDIAFFDQKGNCLFYTTTHEGLAYTSLVL
ncbi:hypothetical protein H9636_06970 [Ureibacillus sp. Re31]|uniref:Uncharacterized protein n=1 Tax=Ureibacillus galli TaxID=2762222 RepID=A0ABR8XB19_9BACL|nr:hypothetical protein [Ureibacillus galli]MBD8026398.1 hypothetical protein [Ureibacillus galli]